MSDGFIGSIGRSASDFASGIASRVGSGIRTIKSMGERALDFAAEQAAKAKNFIRSKASGLISRVKTGGSRIAEAAKQARNRAAAGARRILSRLGRFESSLRARVERIILNVSPMTKSAAKLFRQARSHRKQANKVAGKLIKRADRFRRASDRMRKFGFRGHHPAMLNTWANILTSQGVRIRSTATLILSLAGSNLARAAAFQSAIFGAARHQFVVGRTLARSLRTQIARWALAFPLKVAEMATWAVKEVASFVSWITEKVRQALAIRNPLQIVPFIGSAVSEAISRAGSTVQRLLDKLGELRSWASTQLAIPRTWLAHIESYFANLRSWAVTTWTMLLANRQFTAVHRLQQRSMIASNKLEMAHSIALYSQASLHYGVAWAAFGQHLMERAREALREEAEAPEERVDPRHPEAEAPFEELEAKSGTGEGGKKKDAHGVQDADEAEGGEGQATEGESKQEGPGGFASSILEKVGSFAVGILKKVGSGAMVVTRGAVEAGKWATRKAIQHLSPFGKVARDGDITGPFIAGDEADWSSKKPEEVPASPFDDATEARAALAAGATVFINGIDTDLPSHAVRAQALANAKKKPVVGVYNATAGFLRDVMQAGGDILGISPNPATAALTSLLLTYGGEDGKRIDVVAHSQGSIILSNALQAVKAKKGKISQFDVTTLGNAMPFFPSGTTYKHYAFDSDAVASGISGTNSSLGLWLNESRLGRRIRNSYWGDSADTTADTVTLHDPKGGVDSHDSLNYIKSLDKFDAKHKQKLPVDRSMLKGKANRLSVIHALVRSGSPEAPNPARAAYDSFDVAMRKPPMPSAAYFLNPFSPVVGVAKLAWPLLDKRLRSAVSQLGSHEDWDRAMENRAKIQRSEDGEGLQVQEPDAASLLAELRQSGGSGQTLPTDVRKDLGPYVGFDPSRAKVHVGPAADRAAKELGARAFTIGSDVFFKAGEYNPQGTEGKALLAHELTHVAQQTGQHGQRVDKHTRSGGQRMEQEAQQTESRVLAGVGSRETRLNVRTFRKDIEAEGAEVTAEQHARVTRIGDVALARVGQLLDDRALGGPIRLMEIEVSLDLDSMTDDEAASMWAQAIADRLREFASSPSASNSILLQRAWHLADGRFNVAHMNMPPPVARQTEPMPDDETEQYDLNIRVMGQWYGRVNKFMALVALRNSYRFLRGQIEAGAESHDDYRRMRDHHWFTGGVSDLLSGARMPSLDIWLTPAYWIRQAHAALIARNVPAAFRTLAQAQHHLRQCQRRIYEYREGTISGAERAVYGLEIVRDVSAITVGVIATVVTGGATATVIGVGYAGVQQVAQQGTEVSLGLRDRIDWAGIAFDALIGLIIGRFMGRLGNRFAARFLQNPAVAHWGRVAVVRAFQYIVIQGRGQAIFQRIARNIYDHARGSREAMTVDQLIDAIVRDLSDPRNYFYDLLSGHLGTRADQARQRRTATPPPPDAPPPPPDAPPPPSPDAPPAPAAPDAAAPSTPRAPAPADAPTPPPADAPPAPAAPDAAAPSTPRAPAPTDASTTRPADAPTARPPEAPTTRPADAPEGARPSDPGLSQRGVRPGEGERSMTREQYRQSESQRRALERFQETPTPQSAENLIRSIRDWRGHLQELGTRLTPEQQSAIDAARQTIRSQAEQAVLQNPQFQGLTFDAPGTPGFRSDIDIGVRPADTSRLTTPEAVAREIQRAGEAADALNREITRRTGGEPDRTLDVNVYPWTGIDAPLQVPAGQQGRVTRAFDIASLVELRRTMSPEAFAQFRDQMLAQFNPNDPNAPAGQRRFEAQSRAQLEAQFREAQQIADRLTSAVQTEAQRLATAEPGLSERGRQIRAQEMVMQSIRRRLVAALRQTPVDHAEVARLQAEMLMMQPGAYGTRAGIADVVGFQQPLARAADSTTHYPVDTMDGRQIQISEGARQYMERTGARGLAEQAQSATSSLAQMEAHMHQPTSQAQAIELLRQTYKYSRRIEYASTMAGAGDSVPEMSRHTREPASLQRMVEGWARQNGVGGTFEQQAWAYAQSRLGWARQAVVNLRTRSLTQQVSTGSLPPARDDERRQ
ncbi:MAG: DUF4157 domain-containing protein [Fimbriimonadaceae bacterium]|nr:MAG: DUF4157 domain-containing protein [Fimbriimonadaceae bacterium]